MVPLTHRRVHHAVVVAVELSRAGTENVVVALVLDRDRRLEGGGGDLDERDHRWRAARVGDPNEVENAERLVVLADEITVGRGRVEIHHALRRIRPGACRIGELTHEVAEHGYEMGPPLSTEALLMTKIDEP